VPEQLVADAAYRSANNDTAVGFKMQRNVTQRLQKSAKLKVTPKPINRPVDIH
jgi:hypothetical protein